MPVGVVVPRTGAVIANRVRWARTPVERARGLLRSPPLEQGEVLVIEPARQVHTFGMHYPIDVCFCDGGWTVLHVVTSLRPRRITRWVRRARYALEAPAGALEGLEPGDQLSLNER